MAKKPSLENNPDIAKNLVRPIPYISRRDRNALNRNVSGLLWFTGYSGAGKSTIAYELERELFKCGIRSYVLDGDNVRYGLNADLGFSREDRKENIRRIGELAKLFVDAGLVVLTAFISPYREDREFVRNRFKGDRFYEIYVKCSIQECEQRDPKGMYRKARQGIIKNYTGVSAPYEEPESPELVVDTERSNVEDSIRTVLDFMAQAGMLGSSDPND